MLTPVISIQVSVWRKCIDFCLPAWSAPPLVIRQHFPTMCCLNSTGIGGWTWSRALRWNKHIYKPHSWVQGYALWVVQLLIQQGHTSLTVLVAHKHPVIHVIHKVEVSCQPVDGHLLHIWWVHRREGEKRGMHSCHLKKEKKNRLSHVSVAINLGQIPGICLNLLFMTPCSLLK